MGGVALVGLAAPSLITTPLHAARRHVIRMRSDRIGARVWFDPIGLFVEPGDTVRWIIAANVHTTTAYHPANANHSLRIPETAQPWDSGVLTTPGQIFEVQLTVEGVYDYFCTPHEAAGMVGRIIVGRPHSGPGTRPYDYFESDPARAGWREVPAAARKAFPSVVRIMKRRVVRAAIG
jgi:plastocyanin